MNIKEFPNKYDTTNIEEKWQKYWEEAGVYKWDPQATREESYVIDTPPPTVSGHLHMGHIYSYTQADFIARFQRMSGKSVFYPIGFDDNGLPTERLVEKTKKIRGYQVPRAEFIKLCKEVVETSENEFRKLFTHVALSVDWDQEYQTISEQTQTLSQMSFMDLFEKQRVYRTFEPTIWDPIDGTALAQADLEDKEQQGMMNEIKFMVDNEEFYIATTRPELLPACVAVFFHPDDLRYKHMAGKTARTALFEAEVSLIADDKVNMEKGTGLVMCCTFGDMTDIDWWKKYKLNTRIIINRHGKMDFTDLLASEWNPAKNPEVVALLNEVSAVKVEVAREKILEALKAKNLVRKQTEVVQNVKVAERSGAKIEILVTPQWNIKVLDLKEQILEKARQVEWRPAFMFKRLENWVEGLSWDWTISRQRFFGVQFPVWYSKRAGEEGRVLLPTIDQLPVDPTVDLPKGYMRDEVDAETDVMDTWATSALTPQLSSRGVSQKYNLDSERHAKLYPADLRPQAHEIIRTWAFVTIVKSLLHEDKAPWKNIMISGWCLAADKTKMSKSKGNVVTPTGLLQEKGADVVRYWAATSKLGADTAYSEDVLGIGKKLVNKVWNACKFASLHLQKLKQVPTGTAAELIKSGQINRSADLWILSRLAQVINKATSEFENYEYSTAMSLVEEFFWKDLCDNYLEIVKSRCYDEEGKDPAGQQSAVVTIYFVFKEVLKLFAPFIPHITEELYDLMYKGKGEKSIHQRGSWPKKEEYIVIEDSITLGKRCVEILDWVRQYKSDKQISIKTPVEKLIVFSQDDLSGILSDLKNVTNAVEIILSDEQEIFDFQNDNKDLAIRVVMGDAV